MNYVVMLVFEDIDKLDAILDALCRVGVGGATIIESTGLHRRRSKKAHIPLRFNFEHLAPLMERGNCTLMTLVDESVVESCVAAIEQVLGSLDQPNTGVLAAWPASIVRGLTKQSDRTTCTGKEAG